MLNAAMLIGVILYERYSPDKNAGEIPSKVWHEVLQ
jgi:hypothetical protein